MTLTSTFRVLIVAVALLIGAAAGTERDAAGALPPGNTVEQWDQIAEDTVVGSGVFQNEGYLYMAYESTAVYDAVVLPDHVRRLELSDIRLRDGTHGAVHAAVCLDLVER